MMPDFVTQFVLTVIIGAGATLVTIRIVMAELKRDMVYVKSEIQDLKGARKSDTTELKQIIKDNNEERNKALEKMDTKIDELMAAITDLKVSIAKKHDY